MLTRSRNHNTLRRPTRKAGFGYGSGMGEWCDIYVADLASETDADLALLDPVELARRETYMYAGDRSRFTLGVALSRRAAGVRLGMAAERLRIDRRCVRCGEPHGRPLLPGTGLHLSVSHSAELVVVAVTAAGPVGIDVELIDHGREWPTEQVASMRLAVHEPGSQVPPMGPAASASQVTTTDRLYRTWCRKESVVKATGEGMRVPFDEVVVSAPDARPELLEYRGRTLGAQLTDLKLRAGYAAALTVLADAPVKVRVREWDTGERLPV